MYRVLAGITMMRAGSIAIFTFVVALASTSLFQSHARAEGGESTADQRLNMLVNLRTQWAYLYRGSDQIAATPISSGRRGYRTRTGTFTVLQKQTMHRSNKYHHARMPFMQRLAWDGLALHAGGVPRHPSSHGCVHLPTRFARWLYNQPTMGMRVVITDEAARARPGGVSSSVVAAADSEEAKAASSE
jgi:hypothetical protein